MLSFANATGCDATAVADAVQAARGHTVARSSPSPVAVELESRRRRGRSDAGRPEQVRRRPVDRHVDAVPVVGHLHGRWHDSGALRRRFADTRKEAIGSGE